MKCVLDVKSSVSLLRRSNLISTTVTVKELTSDIYTFIEEIFMAAENDDIESIIDDALISCYELFSSYAYPKVLYAAISDNHILINQLKALIPRMRKSKTIELRKSHGNFLVISLLE